MALYHDVFPVFLSDGRGARGMAQELFSAYRLHSLILSPTAKKRKRRRYATTLPVKEAILPVALGDYADGRPFGNSLLLFPGSLHGAELLGRVKAGCLSRYLLAGDFDRVPPAPERIDGCRFLTAYRKRDGGVLYSVGGMVLKAEKAAPLPAAFTAADWQTAEEDVLRGAKDAFGDDFFGFFTCFDTESGLRFLPYLADGGKLFALSGISPSETVLKDTVYCTPPDSAPIFDTALLPKGDVRVFRMPHFPKEGREL